MGDLLFLSHRIPYPPDKGDKIRAWHVLRHLARTHRIHLGCLIDDPADWAHVPRLRETCADVACFGLHPARQRLRSLSRLRPGLPLSLGYFHHAKLQAWVQGKLAAGAVDRAFVFCSAMAPYVMQAGIPCLLDMVDVDSEKWTEYARGARLPMRAVWAREGRTLLAFERRAAALFDRTLFVSNDECRRFTELAPECRDRIEWVENGVDLHRFSPQAGGPSPFPDAAPALVFTGTMDYWPNAQAVTWFARSVMPLLRPRHPELRFWIVGANPPAELRRLAALPDVRVTGRVPDPRPHLAHATAVVAPLLIARGIQNKILEAMAMGKPVIASPQAFEGVRALPGRDLLVADGAAAMAAAVGEVLDGLHPRLGTAARAAVERHYDWSATLRPLDALLGAPIRAVACPDLLDA